MYGKVIMKFLAYTAEDQGIIIDATDWDDAKHELRKKLNRTAFMQEVKLVNLADGTEKQYIPTLKQSGGGNVEELYTIAQQMNDSTKAIVKYIKNTKEGGDGHVQMPTQTQVVEHPQCSIM